MRVLSILYCPLGLCVLLTPPYSYKLDKFARYLGAMMRQWILVSYSEEELKHRQVPQCTTFRPYLDWKDLLDVVDTPGLANLREALTYACGKIPWYTII
jgi:hypothetical protein